MATNESNRVGTEAGEKSRGAFGAIHGAGEAIRGTINSALDGVGDGIAGRPQGTVESRESARGEESVAQKGINEFNQGVASLKGDKGAAKTSGI
ncbi:RHTO0S01e05710g1_1 [Rhodotorula toruloides]|uniref:RHTO0S01e05710g1_1 n=1 Tax=Rhodotorula toruloides TaxID=5286 RepID=A0A061AK68_RHOTO|nr:RHTO0S01e05710g1_1 [Rhodotorula toruloides]